MINRRIVKSTSMAAIASMLVGTAFAAGVVPAYAGEVANNDITITQPAEVKNQLIPPTVNGRTFKAYRISNYSNAQVNADGKITGYDMKVTNGFTDNLIRDAVKAAVVTGDAVNTNFANVVELKTDGSITFKGDAENLTPLQFVGKYFYGTGADVYGNDNANSYQVRTFADYLLKHLPTGVTAITGVGGANNQVTLDIPDGEEGLYLIIEDPKIDTTTDAFKGETVSRAMLTGTPIKVGTKLYDEVVNDGGKTYKLGSLALKAEKVTLTKDVQGNDQLIQLNSVRTFTINTNVPNYTIDYPNWQAKNFIITDIPTENIDLFKDGHNVRNLVVKATKADGTETTLREGPKALEGPQYADYSVMAGIPESEHGFRISLNDPTAWSGQKLTITYDGVITATTDHNGYHGIDGIDDRNGTVNGVQLDFSNNPNVDDEMAKLTDQEKLFHAQLNMEKVAFDGATDVIRATKLAGAKFEVTVGGNPVAFTKSADGLTYTLNKDATATGVTNEVVFGVQGANGIKPITLDGLAADTSDPVTYTFTETEAPAGYILGDNPVTFTATVTPKFDENGESNGVGIKVESASHANFIDLSQLWPRNAAPDYDTVYTLGNVFVENTKNINDFAKTGGEIVAYIAIALGLAVAGSLTAAVARRNRARKTA